MIVAFSVLLAAAIGVPHLLRLEAAAPAPAAAIWLGALALRAVIAVLAALYVVLYLPSTGLFALVTQWCWRIPLPFATDDLGISGHHLGDLAALAPALMLGVSAVSVVAAVRRAVHLAQEILRRHSIGTGPLESVIVRSPGVMVAAAGLARPRVVVSAGALVALDDAELAAGVAHERGHIARRHRFVLLIGELFRALGFPIPGARRAMRELQFHLERDADRWAIKRRHDPLDLASAICKAADGTDSPALVTLGGGPKLSDRLNELVEPPRGPRRPARQWLVNLTAAALLALAMGLAAEVPATAAGGLKLDHHLDLRHCPHHH